MRAAVIEAGAIGVSERPTPRPGEGELLVRVEAAGLNAADLLQKAGFYPAPPGAPADIPGLELAGTVVANGPGTTRFSEGARVMGIVGGGAQAELCLLPEAVALPVPAHLGWAEAGGFAEAFTTAHDALFTQCHLQPGERLLVTGAAGGVGLAAVQLGSRRGSHVAASVRNAALRDAVAGFGADEVIDPADEGGHGPYDVVIELVGAGAFPEHLNALAVGGRIVFIGVGGTGAKAELDALQVMQRRAVVRGSTLRARPLEEKAATARALESDALGWLDSGDIRVPVAAAYPLDQVADAYERFAAGGKLGKVVLLPGDAGAPAEGGHK
jgi:NADPH2:quinone reductase